MLGGIILKNLKNLILKLRFKKCLVKRYLNGCIVGNKGRFISDHFIRQYKTLVNRV